MWKTIPRQPRENSSCEKSIKQNARLSVKCAVSSSIWVALIALTLGTLANTASAEDEPPPPAPEDFQGAIPDIQATTRLLKIIKSSTSRRVYLIDVSNDPGAAQSPSETETATEIQNPPPAEAGEKPALHKILLIREGEDNIMALRVLRDISGSTQVIAKKIKQYGDHEALELGQNYYALEKLSDVVPPPRTPQDKEDMAEVEPAPLAFDPDLDTGSSPLPDNLDDEFGKKQDRLGASIEEHVVPFERHRHWISAAVGLIRNTPDQDQLNGRYYTAGGIRYGYDIGRRIFVSRDDRLDTFTLEGSLFYYSISGMDASSTDTSSGSSSGTAAGLDTYTITPVAATGRYTYYYTENFGIFLYGGLMKNIVMSSQNSNAERVVNLGRVIPAVGAGALLRVGPQWYTRIDAGLDMIGANLMIRF